MAQFFKLQTECSNGSLAFAIFYLIIFKKANGSTWTTDDSQQQATSLPCKKKAAFKTKNFKLATASNELVPQIFFSSAAQQLATSLQRKKKTSQFHLLKYLPPFPT